MFSRKSQKQTSEAGPSKPSNSSKPWLDLNIELRNKNHQKRFLKLHKRPLISTRWVEQTHLNALDLFDDVCHLCDLIKFRRLLDLPKVGTSKRLTLEFLSTLEREEVKDRNGMEYIRITYQLMNQEFIDDYADINTIFGWPTDSPTAAMLAENEFEPGDLVDESSFNLQTVWTLLTNDPIFNARRSKSSHIIHPAVRYVHRLLVYSVWGRADLGAMSEREMKCLWLMTNPVIDWTCPFPVNYAENFIDRMIEYRDGGHTRAICMGGMISLIALARVPNFSPDHIEAIDTDVLLDWSFMDSKLHWLTRMGPIRRTVWQVGVGRNVWAPWIDLPNAEVTRLVGHRDLETYHQALKPRRAYAPTQQELHAAAADAAAGDDGPPSPPQPPQPSPPRPPSPPRTSSPPRTTFGGETSTSGGITLQTLAEQFDQFRLSTETFQRRQMQESDYQMTYLRGLYAAGVNTGAIPSPYVNYPYHPPQQGPVPGWNNGQPTYPYHPPRPEGFDYRFPGGSDPQYDPDIPHFDTYPVYPPNYHSSVPPMEQTWGNAPIPPWGNYGNQPGSSSNMDEDD